MPNNVLKLDIKFRSGFLGLLESNLYCVVKVPETSTVAWKMLEWVIYLQEIALCYCPTDNSFNHRNHPIDCIALDYYFARKCNTWEANNNCAMLCEKYSTRKIRPFNRLAFQETIGLPSYLAAVINNYLRVCPRVFTQQSSNCAGRIVVEYHDIIMSLMFLLTAKFQAPWCRAEVFNFATANILLKSWHTPSIH